MRRNEMSLHMQREILESAPGSPLPQGIPVPGCDCEDCEIRRLWLAEDTHTVTESLVHDLGYLAPKDRRGLADYATAVWATTGIHLPPAEVLASLAGRSPNARRTRKEYDNDPLPVEAARAVPILDVAKRLGLKLRRMGMSWRGPCPIHNGDGPNFSVHPKWGTFKCFTCDAAGDGIELEMQVAGVGFAAAVKRLAG